MHPNLDSKPMYADAILNGLEIFKLNQSDGSLAGPNPEYNMVPALPAPYQSYGANIIVKRRCRWSSTSPEV
ncbi:hypothetical protein ACSBR2_010241 [Camellia fascicularis]